MLHYRPLGEPTDTKLRRTALLIKQRPPDLKWMLQVMATLNPDHEIFNKDYCRPRNEENVLNMVVNPNGYFDGLPVQKRTGKRMMSLLDSAT